MTHRHAVLLAALVLLACAPTTARSWAFVQDVGGLALGRPRRTTSGVVLPVDVEASGTRAITTRPRALHSAVVAKELRVQREGRTLLLTLLTVPVEGRHRPSPIREALLGELAPGRYEVMYAEPAGGRVPMGTVTVPP